MTLVLTEVASAIGSPAVPPPIDVSGWSVDSRTLAAGELFFALRGPNHDGHDYVGQVFERGAAAAVVERTIDTPGTLLPVADSGRALEDAARWARCRWGGQVVAVTGSAGKTTTKDIIASLLATELAVGKTVGNFNNQVGLPLSILRLPQEAKVAVFEIGMNHAGEIRNLAAIAAPLRAAVVTNVGSAHLEYFDSIEAVALAKRELIESLPADGVAVLNADDPRVLGFREVHPGPAITFGLSESAHVRAEDVVFSPEGARFRVAGTVFESPLAGRHGVLNVLAGLAVARVFGIAPQRLADVVRSFVPGPMRGQRIQRQGVTILNDCYNSNPEAVRTMLDQLRAEPARRYIAVLGEMLELGRWSEPLHRDVGRYVAMCGISVLVGIRGAARHMVDEAVNAGLASSAAFFFQNPAEAGDHLRRIAQPGDAVLFKGSRGSRVERALERFLGESSQ